MESFPDDIVPIVGISCGAVIAIVAIISCNIVNMYKIHRQTNLKQMMMEAGFSPPEIERVIHCGLENSSVPHQKPVPPASPAVQHGINP